MTTAASAGIVPILHEIYRQQAEQALAQRLLLEERNRNKPVSADELPGLQISKNSLDREKIITNLKRNIRDEGSRREKSVDQEWDEIMAVKYIEQLHCGTAIEQENAANGLRLFAVEKRLSIPRAILEIAIVDVAEKLASLRPDFARYEVAYVKSLLQFAHKMAEDHLLFMIGSDYVSVLASLLKYHKEEPVREEAVKVLLTIVLPCMELDGDVQSLFFATGGKSAMIALLEDESAFIKTCDCNIQRVIGMLESYNALFSRWAALFLLRSTIDADGEGTFSINEVQATRLANADAVRSLFVGARNAAKEDRSSFLAVVGCLLSSTNGCCQPPFTLTEASLFVDALSECTDCFPEASVFALSALSRSETGLRAMATQEIVHFLLEAATKESYSKFPADTCQSVRNTCPTSLRASSTLCAIAHSRDLNIASKAATAVPILLSRLFLANGGDCASPQMVTKSREELTFDVFIGDLFSLKGELGYS